MAQDYDYGQLIDDFELGADVMPDETLTQYIERRRREFESKADGGSIGIEVFFGPKREDFNIGGNVQRATIPQPYDSRATAADFARAIQNVGAGTDLQKAMDIQRYGENVQRQNMLSKIKDAGTNLAMRAYGLDPTKAGIAQSPSMLEFQEIKTAGLPQKDYSAASTYGLLEDITEGNPITRALAGTIGLAALPANEVLRPAYDLIQGVYKGATDPNKSIPQAIKDQKIPEMLAGSREGVLQFIGDQFGFTNNRQDIVDSITKTPTYDSASAGAIITDGDSKYRINADGSRSLIGKIEDAPIIDRPTMADVAGPKMIDGVSQEGIIPGFKRQRTGPRGNYNEYSYVGPDGQTYGAETYASIAAGRYPDIYDPNPNRMMEFTGESFANVPISVLNLLRTIPVSDYNKQGPKTQEVAKTILEKTGKPYQYFLSLKDGGRVGLFMGGPALTGTALDIYNSMKAYGFKDAEIANVLRARGLYDTTPAPTTTAVPLEPNITKPNGGGRDENDNGGVKDPRSGLGFSTANFGLGPNQDVMDYEADAAKIGPTIRGQIAKGRLGIQSLISKMRSLPTPLNIALNLAGKVGDFFDPQRATREAMARESVRDLQDRIDKGQFGSTTPTPQDKARAGGGGGGGGAHGMAGRSAQDHQDLKDGGLATMFVERR